MPASQRNKIVSGRVNLRPQCAANRERARNTKINQPMGDRERANERPPAAAQEKEHARGMSGMRHVLLE